MSASSGPSWTDPMQLQKGGPMNVNVPHLEKLLELDPYLKDHEREIRRRYVFLYQNWFFSQGT